MQFTPNSLTLATVSDSRACIGGFWCDCMRWRTAASSSLIGKAVDFSIVAFARNYVQQRDLRSEIRLSLHDSPATMNAFVAKVFGYRLRTDFVNLL